MGRALKNGVKELGMKDSGLIIKSRDKGSSSGQTVELTKGTGSRTKFKGKAIIRGLMVGATKASTSATRRVVLGHIFGLMAKSTKAFGRTESNMAAENSLTLQENREWASGKMANG